MEFEPEKEILIFDIETFEEKEFRHTKIWQYV